MNLVGTVEWKNFREVYILRFLRFDRIRENLSREFVNITIQTHNTVLPSMHLWFQYQYAQISGIMPRCIMQRRHTVVW